VKERTQEILAIVHDDMPVEKSQSIEDNQIIEAVEAKAVSNVMVISQHKSAINKWRNILGDCADLLTKQLEKGEMLVNVHDKPVEIDIPADYVTKALASGTQALTRLVQLERQAHGLDVDQGGQEAVRFNIYDADA